MSSASTQDKASWLRLSKLHECTSHNFWINGVWTDKTKVVMSGQIVWFKQW